jgi:hypothetical protein
MASPGNNVFVAGTPRVGASLAANRDIQDTIDRSCPSSA